MVMAQLIFAVLRETFRVVCGEKSARRQYFAPVGRELTL